MNCGNFEAVITELARDQIVEAHLREAALEHPRYCAVCASRFANEMALTAGLRALAVQTAASMPSDKVETALLEALRKEIVTASNSVNRIVPINSTRKVSRFALAAAAIIVIALTSILVIAIRLQRNSSPISGGASANNQNPKPAPSKTGQSPEVAKTPDSQPDLNHNLRASNKAGGRFIPVRHRVPGKLGQETMGAENPDPTAGFISLTGSAEYMPLESGQIVKVEMPRAALLAIGLPMNGQRAGETVKAELLVGQDGIARAIRFSQ